jgi:hypothetical protein
MDAKTEAYFQRSVIHYSKGDVETLLKAKLDCAGPLLVTTLNGIDNLGGMCYGFGRDNVGERIKCFLADKMHLSKSLAAFLYESVRCGEVHQGMPKMGLEFFVQYDGTHKGIIFYSESDDYIILDVTELAQCYLKAIEDIAKEPEKHIKYYPQYTDKERALLKAAFETARKDIAKGTLIYTQRQFDVDECERSTSGQSSAAYTGEMQFYIDLPPEHE